MSNELNTELYNRLSAEQKQYRKWLLEQSPAEILHHCYEYIVREDIVLTMAEHPLSDKQCRALLQSPYPLSDLYHDFAKRETDYMDNIRDTIECRANKIIREDFLRQRGDER